MDITCLVRTISTCLIKKPYTKVGNICLKIEFYVFSHYSLFNNLCEAGDHWEDLFVLL